MTRQTAYLPHAQPPGVTSPELYRAFHGRFHPRPVEQVSFPTGLRAHLWRPRVGRLVPPYPICGLGSEKMLTQASLAFFSLVELGHGAMARGTVALATDEHSAVQGFAVLRGRDFRFPFMGPHDLQLGPVWTAEPFRRKGLATALCRLALQQVEAADVLWWLCRPDNQASKAVAQAVGLTAASPALRRVLPFFRVSYRYTLRPFPTGLNTACMS